MDRYRHQATTAPVLIEDVQVYFSYHFKSSGGTCDRICCNCRSFNYLDGYYHEIRSDSFISSNDSSSICSASSFSSSSSSSSGYFLFFFFSVSRRRQAFLTVSLMCLWPVAFEMRVPNQDALTRTLQDLVAQLNSKTSFFFIVLHLNNTT